MAVPSKYSEMIFFLETGELTDFEGSFVKSIKKQRQWTEKQTKCLDRIILKYFGVAYDIGSRRWTRRRALPDQSSI